MIHYTVNRKIYQDDVMDLFTDDGSGFSLYEFLPEMQIINVAGKHLCGLRL